jgi:hypothetical protein
LQNTDDDELLNAQIALTRTKHEIKQLAARLVAAKSQLDKARAELARYKQ